MFEVIEAYPQDKYLHSYLVFTKHDEDVIHVLFAVEVHGDNVRIVTAYTPDQKEWQTDLRTRRSNP